MRSFIDWITDRLDKPESFIHAYNMKKLAKSWGCKSLYSAYMSCNLPANSLASSSCISILASLMFLLENIIFEILNGYLVDIKGN